MRIQSLLLPLTVLIAVGGAFAAGYYIAGHDAEKANRSVIAQIQADHAAQTFKVASSVRLAINAAKHEQAAQILTTWVAMQAPTLMECRTSPACTAWVGPSMPTQAQIQEMLAADRTLTDLPATR